MQNHALSLAQQVRQLVRLTGTTWLLGTPNALHVNLSTMQAGFQVDVIAYGGSKTSAAISMHPRIRVHQIPELYASSHAILLV